MSVSVEADASSTLTVLCRALLEDVDGLAAELTTRILARENVYEILGVPDDDLGATCRASLERLLVLLAGDLPSGVDAAELTVDTGRRRARQGVPLEVVLRAYRQCGRLVWERMRAVSRQRYAGAHDGALLVAADTVWRVLDASSDRLVDAYRREETRLRGLELGRRWAVLEALLAGRGHEPAAVRDAARLLDVPDDAELLCVVVPTGEGHGTSGADLPWPAPDEVLAGSVDALWHARSAEVVGLVVLPDGAGRGAEDTVVASLTDGARGPVGVSPRVRGLGRLHVAHRWARLAARTVPAGEVRVATLDEHLPEAFLVEAPDLVPHLRRVALGALLDLPERDRRTMLDTLGAVLAAGGSPSRVAAALYCHRNTVMGRLARLEELTGRRVSDPRDRLLLQLAVAAPFP